MLDLGFKGGWLNYVICFLIYACWLIGCMLDVNGCVSPDFLGPKSTLGSACLAASLRVND